MQRLWDLYQELYENDIKFVDAHIDSADAITVEVDDQYAVLIDPFKIDTTAEELCVVAHEGGHIMTGSTHHISSPLQLVSKHEYNANAWAVKKLIPVDELKAVIENGNHEVWEIASELGVTEPFLVWAIGYYERIGLIPPHWGYDEVWWDGTA